MFAFTEIITPIPELFLPSFIWFTLRVLFLWVLLTGKFNASKKLQKWVLLPLIK